MHDAHFTASPKRGGVNVFIRKVFIRVLSNWLSFFHHRNAQRHIRASSIAWLPKFSEENFYGRHRKKKKIMKNKSKALCGRSPCTFFMEKHCVMKIVLWCRLNFQFISFFFFFVCFFHNIVVIFLFIAVKSMFLTPLSSFSFFLTSIFVPSR